jgi:GDSL-like lipase/acylhydrolase family protein
LGVRATLVVAALLLLAILGEAAARLAFRSDDLLTPVLVRNDALGVRVRPGGTAGFDVWGFRNAAVPERTDVVAAGDSFTYGFGARRGDAWPGQLARILGASVYNLGMPAWGPDQYDCALRAFGLRLAPKVVVIGVYPGNDLRDAIMAGPPAACESLDPAGVARLDRESVEVVSGPRFLGSLRDRLARRSALYQAVKLGLPGLARSISSSLVIDSDYVSRDIRGHRVVLRTESWLESHPQLIDEGLEKTLAALGRTAQGCRSRGTKCVVLLIPSREAVYGDLAADAPGIKQVAAAEAAVAARLAASLRDRMGVVDALPALRKAAADGLVLFPASEDIHLNATGQHALARAVAPTVHEALRP